MEKKAFSVPEQLKDRYAEIEEISSGGMGVIYKACDRVLNKQVAIKMLFADSLTQNAVVRFQREARAASRFKHANLMGVLDFGMSGNNEPYLVMEFVQGKSLAAILDIRKRLSTDELVRIVTQICDGMAHAHSRDVVHRDLKPSNIMIVGSNEANGEGSIVKIVDFGIAKMEYSSDTEGWSTDPGGLIGSPLYMSPEQARGDEVDSRTDIYSLGCIMYEMLSGQAPFLEPTPVETIRAHLKNDPPPIATSHQNTLLGKDLAGVIIECLAKNVDDRPQTMQALKEKILACGFVDEGPLAAAGRKRAWFLQPRPLILASIFLFLSVSILAILDHAKRDELIRMKA
ncbi:MAG: serine/threonine protein kinase, partial [Candidatus Obscuribacterales bacterium]|nr:serine/threonine protein kinase [Candidatus Obscuribacterales bacterium]